MSKKMEKGTENAIFLDGRGYTAADLYRLIGLLVGNGVYANELAPTATNEDMSITHGAGHAWISGVAYWNTTPFVLEIATADGSLNRYDSLMLRLDLSINEVYAVIVQGAYATNPTPPTCTRNAETFDLKLCDIYVPAGCTKITQDKITDTRLDSSVCGVPVFPVEHMDMSSFYRQIATDLANFQQSNEAEFSAWVEDQKDSNLATLAALVEVVRNTSDGSVAEIEALLQQLNALVDSDTVGELTNAINDKLPKSGGAMTGEIRMNGQPISGLNDPTEDTQAARKGYVDSAKEEAKAYTDTAKTEANTYTDTAVRKADPYNYAHNSDFTQFVAQAGVGGLHGTQAYAGDRWILDSGTVTGEANENGNGYRNITLNGTIRQIIANPPAVGTAGVEMISGTAAVSYANGELTITSAGGIIKNVLLCAAETLPEYRPKGYGAELAECARYYLRSYESTPKTGGSGPIMIFLAASSYAGGSVLFPSEMRVTPTVTLYNPDTGNSGVVCDWSNSADVAASPSATSKGFLVRGGGRFTQGKYYGCHYEANADL